MGLTWNDRFFFHRIHIPEVMMLNDAVSVSHCDLCGLHVMSSSNRDLPDIGDPVMGTAKTSLSRSHAMAEVFELWRPRV